MPRPPFTGLLLLLAACGARTGLPVPSTSSAPEADAATDAGPPEDASVGPICSPSLDAGPLATCSSWRAGAEVDVSPGGASGQMAYFTSVVPSGDGVLATWFALTDDTQPAAWVTRRLGFDGVPLGPARDHLSFATDGAGSSPNVMSLAANACAFAGVVDDPVSGCRFLPLDGDGRETAAVVSPTSRTTSAGTSVRRRAEPSRCSGLQQQRRERSVQLLTVSASGQSGATAKPLPGITSAVVSPRLVLRDGTFLLSTFGEVDSGALAIDMRHFAADGTLLAGPFPLSDTAYSIVYMAETSSGVLAAWMGDANDKETVIVAALDHDGNLRAPPAPVVASENDALYGFALASTPAGDGLVAWQSLTDGSSFDLQIQALAPDGTPRGTPTNIGTYGSLGVIRAVVSADGEKAVLLFTAEEENVTPSVTDGMRAVPLTCVP